MLRQSRFAADPWALVETDQLEAALGVTESLFAVSNGYVGIRGTPEEGEPADDPGTFINGVYETWSIDYPERAFGLAEVGQAMLHIPEVSVIRLFVGDEPLDLGNGDVISYERSLRFDDGLLLRRLLWRTASGNRVRVTSTRTCLFHARHLALMTYEVELLDEAAPVTLSSHLVTRSGGRYQPASTTDQAGMHDPRQASAMGTVGLEPARLLLDRRRVLVELLAPNSGLTAAVGIDHLLRADCAHQANSHKTDLGALVLFEFSELPAGQSITLEKYATFHISEDRFGSDLVLRSQRGLDQGLRKGADALLSAQRAWLDRYWATADVQIEGDDSAQQAVRWHLYQIAQAAARADSRGVPAKGLTGSGYGGHYFWDTEIYLMPFLSFTQPQIARNLIRFRYKMLPAARRRAELLGHPGALFPWRTINGEEASAYYEAGTAQYHINADIVHALHRYTQITGEEALLGYQASELLVETARLWLDLGHASETTGHFHIHGVTGPDEYTALVNDNLYTNTMARFNLSLAADNVDRLRDTDPASYRRLLRRTGLKEDEPGRWRDAADVMYVGYDERLGIHPQDDSFLDLKPWDFSRSDPQHPLMLKYHPLAIYRHQMIKQADVVLAMFLLREEFDPAQIRRNFDFYEPLTTGDSSLSASIQAVVAYQTGRPEVGLGHLENALYLDLDDRHANTRDGVHIANSGGVWLALVYGVAGFKDQPRLEVDPQLPPGWTAISFVLDWRGRRLRVRVSRDGVEVSADPGPDLELVVKGRPVTAVTAG